MPALVVAQLLLFLLAWETQGAMEALAGRDGGMIPWREMSDAREKRLGMMMDPI